MKILFVFENFFHSQKRCPLDFIPLKPKLASYWTKCIWGWGVNNIFSLHPLRSLSGLQNMNMKMNISSQVKPVKKKKFRFENIKIFFFQNPISQRKMEHFPARFMQYAFFCKRQFRQIFCLQFCNIFSFPLSYYKQP